MQLEDGLGYLQVPPRAEPDRPRPLLVSLHGAGGDAMEPIERFGPVMERHGVLLLGVKSERETWDALVGGYGPDVARLDRALSAVFDRAAVDASRLAVGGFSDGASYALGLGLANGDLFTHIIAFSPGFIPETGSEDQGQPRIFISHGTGDAILPIQRTSRRIVPGLQGAGYAVTYREFDGPHWAPEDIVLEAVQWLLR